MKEYHDAALLMSLFNSSEIEFVRSIEPRCERHPLNRLLFPQERDSQVVENMRGALIRVFDKDETWMLRQKERLLSTDDYSHASSALSEIRAYGALLGTGLPIKANLAGSVSEPDFFIEEGEEKIFVEVHSKRWSQEEEEAFIKFNNEQKRPTIDGGVTMRLHITTPFGVPKKEQENVTINAIHKLAQMKQQEEKQKQQFSRDHTSILWVDFQDEAWNLLLHENDAQPVKTWQGGFWSGPIWYAFYGWKGAPVFEGQRIEEGFKRPAKTMPHDGRFHKEGTKIDAVIMSFPRSTIILENHHSRKPIRSCFWGKLFLLPWFSFEGSYTNYPNATLKQRVEFQKEMLESLFPKAIYSW